ncbi:LPXTG cell wall anchor domain-containing protein [Limosilactobacillus antri]|uniref:LPXTG cell wall anchor domain-containing protein n=1 Tax=Limosilactobacillus antri TaxID=227943 RepID=UPI001F57BA32|nr:LPXTG cell wall anchor domain-containing protein [Limosilactobacillus antri]
MNKKTKSTLLIAGAVLTTTAVTTATNQVKVHADTTGNAATGQTEEQSLQNQNADYQQQINQINQHADQVKADRQAEIDAVSQKNQADYQKQADAINADYNAQIAKQQQQNASDEAAMKEANAQAVEKAKADQQAAMAHSAEVEAQAKSDYQQATSQAQAAQDAAIKQADQAQTSAQQQEQNNYDQAIKNATTARDQATKRVQDTFNQESKAAGDVQQTAKAQAQTTYDNAVKQENTSFDQAKANAATAKQDALNKAQQAVKDAQANKDAKQQAYDNAVKNAPKISHGGTQPIDFSSEHTPTGVPNGPIPTNIGNLPLVPTLSVNTSDSRSINYQPDQDKSAKFTGSKEQVEQLTEYAQYLINQILKQKGLKSIPTSQEITNAIQPLTFDKINFQANTSKEVDLTKLSQELSNNHIDLSYIITPLKGPLNRKYDGTMTMLAQAYEIYDTIFHYHDEIIQDLDWANEANDHVAIVLLPDGTGMDIVFADMQQLDPDYGTTIGTTAGTPLPNAGFVDAIKAAQAGNPTPDLNAASVVNAKKALDQANQQLSQATTSLAALQNGQTDPLTTLTNEHNSKLSQLKNTYDSAIKQAEDTYHKVITQATQKRDTAIKNANDKYQTTVDQALQDKDKTIQQAKTVHDQAVNKAKNDYNQTVKQAKDKYDLEIAKASGDPTYVDKITQQLADKLNAKIKDDQAKIDAIKAKQQEALTKLKQDTDAKTNDEIQAILTKYGVSDAQINADIAPLQAKIDANNQKLAAIKAAREAAASANTRGGQYQLGNGSVVAFPSVHAAAAGHTQASQTEASLPQTGNENSAAVIALGAIASMLGLGLAGEKRNFN